MRRTKLSEFTGGDAIKLVTALYLIRSVYQGVSEVCHPRLRRLSAELDEKRRIQKAEEALKSSE